MNTLPPPVRCNYYYYLLHRNKAYLIFKYLRLTGDFQCISDALIRKQKIYTTHNIFHYYHKDVVEQYKIINQLSEKFVYIYTVHDLISRYLYDIKYYIKSGYLFVIQYMVNFILKKLKFEFNFANDMFNKAVISNQLSITYYMRQYITNIDNTPDMYHTVYNVLQSAAERNYLDMVKLLLDLGATVTFAVLINAIKFNNLDILKILVQNTNVLNYNLFFDATKNNNIPIIDYILNHINITNEQQQSILNDLIFDNNFTIFKHLVHKDFSINSNTLANSHYYKILTNNNLAFIQYINENLSLDQATKQKLIHTAQRLDKPEIVQYLTNN